MLRLKRIPYFFFFFLFSFFLHNLTATQNITLPDQIQEILSDLADYEYGQSARDMAVLDSLLRSMPADPALHASVESKLLTALRGESTSAAKQYICEKLSIYGTEASVPVLTVMLKESSTFEMALYALNRIPAPEATAALIGALDFTEGVSKTGVINAIGEKKDPAASKKLAEIADGDERDQAEAALYAMGSIADDRSFSYLGKRIKASDDPLHDAAVQAFLICTESRFGQDKNNEIYDAYRELFRKEEPKQIQFAALRGMILSQPDKAAANIRKVLETNNTVQVEMAIRLIKYIPEQKDIGPLLSGWEDLSEQHRIELLSTISTRNDPAVNRLLKQAVEDPEISVRIAALSSISRMTDPALVETVLEKAAHGSPEERRAAQSALTQMPGEEVEARIRTLASEKGVAEQYELIRAMGARYDKEALPVVKTFLESTDPELRLEAVTALQNLGGYEELKILVAELAGAENRRERETLKKSVFTLADNLQRKKAELLINYFSECTSDENRVAFIQVMGRLADPGSVPFLRGYLMQGSPEMQIETVKAVEDWPDDTFRPDLLYIAEGATDDKLRVLATRAYVKTIPYDTKSTGNKKAVMYELAMRLARTDAEKKMILSALTEQPDLHALRFASRFLNREGLEEEAAAAVIEIGSNLPAKHASVVLDILESVALDEESAYLRERLEETRSNLLSITDFIYTWQVTGPYSRDNVSLLDHAFAPETDMADQAEWRTMPQNPDPDQYWYIPLDTQIGGDNQVVYLRTRVHSPEERDARLELGSDDGIKVWLNGELIHRIDMARGVRPGDDIVPVRLRKGWNNLMLKVSNGNGGWGACARFRSADGGRLGGLEYRLPE